MSLVGHIGPGIYIYFIGLLYALRALRLRRLLRFGALENIQLSVLVCFVPLAAFLEWFWRSKGPYSMTTAHHMILYALLMLELSVLQLWRRGRAPRGLLTAYQVGVMAVAAAIFTGHNMGNDLFVGMHVYMCPLLLLGAALHPLVVTEAAAPALGRALAFVHCLALLMAGQLFFHIGVAFYLYGGSGLEGSRHDPMDAMEAREKLNFYLAVHFIVVSVGLAAAQVALSTYGLLAEDDVTNGSATPTSAENTSFQEVGKGGSCAHNVGGGARYAKLASPWRLGHEFNMAQNLEMEGVHGLDNIMEGLDTAGVSPVLQQQQPVRHEV